ncbi:hypothetical protein [Microcystis sp. BLCC-F210]|uniref:hypothetical protein n=1 Tax=Microcystis sp. BLCC-F210 TaxID=3342751 RepID=UPI0035C8F879
MSPYPPEIETQMQRFYQSLSEKDSRRYAAIEALKLGYGGISYLSRLFGCNYRTIIFGMEELTDEESMSLDFQGVTRRLKGLLDKAHSR